MSLQKIYSFSIPESEPELIDLVESIKKKCKKSGQSFSWIVLQALKHSQESSKSSHV